MVGFGGRVVVVCCNRMFIIREVLLHVCFPCCKYLLSVDSVACRWFMHCKLCCDLNVAERWESYLANVVICWLLRAFA